MIKHEGGNAQPTIDREEHRSVNGVNAKAVAPYGYDGTDLQPLKTDTLGRLTLDPNSVGGGGGLTDAELRATPVEVTTAGELQTVEVINALRAILQAIANPSYVDKSLNAIRNQVQSGTITTVTTVTTVAGITNMDGYQAKLQVINQNNAAWASVVRARIS